MDGHTAAAADLLPNATNKDGGRGGRSTPTIRKELLRLSFRFADKDQSAGAADATAW